MAIIDKYIRTLVNKSLCRGENYILLPPVLTAIFPSSHF
jgi:hypothetical protein